MSREAVRRGVERASKAESIRLRGVSFKYQSNRRCARCGTVAPMRLNENDRCLTCEGKREHFFLWRPDLR